MTITANVNLDVTQYKQVNIGFNPMKLQAHRDSVRIVFADAQPLRGNPSFHLLGGDDPILPVDALDTNVWALAMTDRSSLTVTEFVNLAPDEVTQFDPNGNMSRNTVVQEQLVAQREDMVNIQFQYNVPINDDATDVLGGTTDLGTISHADSMAQVSSGAGIGYAYVESRDSIRYYPGHEFAFELTAKVTGAADAGSHARWGMGNVDGIGDALAFGYIDGVFGVVFRSDGVEQFIPQADFNQDKLDGTGDSKFDIDITKVNIFTVRGGWYGVLPLQFGVYSPDVGYVTCHIINRANTSTTPHLSNPSHNMFVEAGRTNVGDSITLSTASWRGGICGPRPEGSRADRYFTRIIEGKAIPGGGVITPVISLRNNSTFQGKPNHVRARIGTLALSTDGTKSVIWQIFKNGTLTAPVWTPEDSEASVVDYDDQATAYVASSNQIGGTAMGKVDNVRINLFADDVVLPVYPGETITVAARSANSTEVTLFFRWIEEF